MFSGASIGTARGIGAAGDEIHRRLQLALLLRVIMVTFLMGATVFIHFSRKPSLLTVPLIAIYIVSGATYFITLVSLLVLRRLEKFDGFSFIQILVDTAFVSSLIYITGGVHSIFSFLYLLTIVTGGTLQYRRGAFLAAVAGALCYGALILGLDKGWVPGLIKFERLGKWEELLYYFLINLSAMFGTAVLSSYLTEKLRAAGVELKETRKDRDQLEALNENIIRSISSGLVTLDQQNRVMTLNRAAAEITGLDEKNAGGHGLAEVFPPAGEALAASFPKTFKETGRHEIKWKDPGKPSRYLEFKMTPLVSGDGERQGTLVFIDDNTEIRRMEARLQKSDRLAAVGQLAAGMAHEIRNPLASISGAIQMLGQDIALDDTNRRLMKIILREIDRLNGLLTDFLLFARPSPKAIYRVNLRRLLGEIAEVFKHRSSGAEGIRWQIDIDGSLDLETDPGLLQQIFWNLANNSAQAMLDGGVITIKAESSAGLDGREEVCFEITDTGAGIPSEIANRIFDPFFTTREGGTGLGLSVVFRIVEAMEGSIVADPEHSPGAKFVIRLPRRLLMAPASGGLV